MWNNVEDLWRRAKEIVIALHEAVNEKDLTKMCEERAKLQKLENDLYACLFLVKESKNE